MACQIFGIKNCATMKKAFAWCDEHGVEYTFHDYKKQGVPQEMLLAWCQVAGWKALVNTRGTTYRKFTPEQQDIQTQNPAVALMMEYPSLIKRPVVVTDGGQLVIGFDPTTFSSLVR